MQKRRPAREQRSKERQEKNTRKTSDREREERERDREAVRGERGTINYLIILKVRFADCVHLLVAPARCH